MANSYVLLDLVSINVTTISTDSGSTIVFCESINVKRRENQTISSVADWSNIIIGDPKYNDYVYNNDDGSATINVTYKDTDGSLALYENIGLWSMILFTTKTDDVGAYTQLGDVIGGAADIGGSGTGTTGVTLVYYNTDGTSYVKPIGGATVVDAFLKDMLGKTYNDSIYNGCIFIDNSNCGLFLNISAAMFNKQTNLEKISLTNTIVYITSSDDPIGVFSNCDNLTNANIPTYLGYYKIIKNGNTTDNTIRAIPGYYFHNCKLLENITIPNRITQIGFSAFYGCDNVETIDIPSSVTSVFSNSLLTVKRTNTRYINVNGDATNKTNITFYNKCIGYNKPTTGDKTYFSNSVVISINNRDTVNLSGSNNINDTSFIDNIGGGSKIYIDCGTINGVKIGNTTASTTKFYQGGFIGTTFETIYIGPSVTSICDFAFYNVTGTNLIINNGNVLDPAKPYSDNTEKNSLEVNKYSDGTYLIKTPFAKSNFNSIHILNCSSIGQYALHNLYTNELKIFEPGDIYTLNNVEYTNTIVLKSLGEYAFYNSNNQSGSIIIPSSVINIRNTSFLQTKGSLELKCNISSYTNTYVDSKGHNHDGILVNSEFSKITFNYTGSIPENILYENKSIKSIYLGANIKTISEKAFYLCTNLTNTLSLPTNLSSIDETAFIGCTFSKFEADSSDFKTANNGMYLLTGDRTGIVLFANKHSDIQITDNTFNIDIDINTVNKICGYAFAYAFSDYANSNVYAVNIPESIMHFGRNVFYNCHKLTRITFYPKNIASFTNDEISPNGITVNNVSLTTISVDGSFSDLPLLKDIYIGYATGILLLDSIPTNNSDERNNFLYNTIRNSYTNNVSDINNITIYVYEDLVETYKKSAWGLANYKISGIAKDVPPPSPVPPTGNDDSYDADIDDPEGEEWPDNGGNGDISKDEDYIPPITTDDDDTSDTPGDDWITHADNEFQIPIRQLGTPSINVYGCRLDLLNPTYVDNHEPLTPLEIIDQFGNINFLALDYLKFNKVSTEIQYGSNKDNDGMLKLYMGDYGNNFLIVFTVTGIDNFDATTKLFTSGVEYATHRESNWLKTEIVRITKKPESDEYYVVLLCTCLKLQNKDNYNCRSAIVSVNYGSQILDSNINNNVENTTNDEENTTNDEENTSKIHITTKIRVIQHKTELRLSNDTREINITDLPVLFCQQDERTEFVGNFFIGFPKNFWGNGKTIENTQKLREYINDYFRILYDKEKIQIVGQVITIDEIEYTYTFDVAEQKYANIKAAGSTTGVLKTFDSCDDNELNGIHEEYYYVNFKIKNKKTSLAGGVWNISIYNIGEPAEMLNIHVIEDQTEIPSIALYPTYAKITGNSWNGEEFSEHTINTENTCSDIRSNNYVAAECQLPVSITNMPLGKNSTYIFPNIETTDICVDSSAVFTCDDNNMVMSADEITNNFNYALTINIKNNTSGVSSFNMPISSKTLKKQSLSAIKYKKTELNINPSIYNYDANSNTAVNACLTNKPEKITIERIGDKAESDILSNTGALLYKINTGLSVIADTYTNYLTRTDNTISYMPIIINDGSTALDTIIKASWVSIENNLCIDLFNDGFIINDEYCNILAPIYPYYNELKYTITDSKTLQLNKYVDSTNVYISGDGKTTYYINNNSLATGQTYYCTTTNDILIQADNTIDVAIEGYDKHVKSKRYIGQAYKVITTTGESPNIGVVKTDDNSSVKYTKDCYGEHSYNDFSKATDVVTLKPMYIAKTISGNSSASTEIGKDDLENARSKYKEHGKIIKVINTVKVTYSEMEVGLCYKDGEKHYNLDGAEINGTEINIKPTFEINDYAWFIYINPNYSNFTITDDVFYMPNTGRPCHVGGPYSDYPYINEDANEINTARFYNIYNITDIDTANGEYTNVSALNTDPIYAYFRDVMPKPNIKYDDYITESFNIADMHVNIYDIACNTNVYRQIFVNFSYDVNDNNTITKIYADNSNGLILQTRMLNYKPNIEDPTFNTKITLFGLDIELDASNIVFGPTVNMPQLYINE